MLFLTRYFESRGYKTLNILYPSREKSLEELSMFVHEKIMRCPDYNDTQTLHFVTHSMGGLIARYYIAQYKPKNLGKVVMLGPPNTGSEFADWFTQNEHLSSFYATVFGPAGAQLTTCYTDHPGEITFPLGIIAGNLSINPIAPWVLEGEHDGIVPVERTKIMGMTDHIVIPATHSFMMFNKTVMEQALHFIEHERFDHTLT